MRLHVVITTVSRSYGYLISCLQSIWEQTKIPASVTLIFNPYHAVYDRVFDTVEGRQCNLIKFDDLMQQSCINDMVGQIGQRHDGLILLNDNICFNRDGAFEDITRCIAEPGYHTWALEPSGRNVAFQKQWGDEVLGDRSQRGYHLNHVFRAHQRNNMKILLDSLLNINKFKMELCEGERENILADARLLNVNYGPFLGDYFGRIVHDPDKLATFNLRF